MQDAMFFISIMYHYALKCGEVVKHWEFFGGGSYCGLGDAAAPDASKCPWLQGFWDYCAKVAFVTLVFGGGISSSSHILACDSK